MTSCPHCGQAMPEEDRLAAAARELADSCRAQGYLVTPDGRVREDAAAALLGMAPGTLRNWSYLEDDRLPYVRVARRRTYFLSDLAALITRE